jgi:hypothetical protein
MGTAYLGAGIQIILLLCFLVPVIFFFITQQNVLEALKPESRLMKPGDVWFQLIPLFGAVYQFFVVRRIADSLRREFASYTNDSILGLPPSAAVPELGKRPTYSIGLSYCILGWASFLPIPLLRSLIALACIICWVVYWISLAGFKRKVLLLRGQE